MEMVLLLFTWIPIVPASAFAHASTRVVKDSPDAVLPGVTVALR